MIPELFERLPPASEGGTGTDHLEAWTDVQNLASQKILQKCGFTYCETIPDPENQLRGPSDILVYRKARPGKTLEELEIAPTTFRRLDSKAPTPPIQ